MDIGKARSEAHNPYLQEAAELIEADLLQIAINLK
jgi:hypothetical protein